MKKHYQKYCTHFAYAIISIFTFLFTTRTVGQEKISITPELSKQVIEKYHLEPFKIYPISIKEIEYKTYDTAQVLTKEYRTLSERLERYKPAFDLYNTTIQQNKEKQEAISTIKYNIENFLNSNDKYDVKEKLLIDSQTLADKYNIQVSVPDDRIKLNDFVKTSNSSQQSLRNILIYEKGKRSNKNDLKTFQVEIQRIKITEPQKTNDYRYYLETLDEINKVPKTEIGKVLSDKIIKKSVYVLQDTPIDIDILSGEFIELSETYALMNESVKYKFAKNELFDQSNEHFNNQNEFDGFPIIKKSDTNQLYYITSKQFLLQMKGVIEREKFKNLDKTSEYKSWKTKYISLLQSAQINVNTCNAIIKKHTYLNRLGQKRYDTETFSKQEKLTFNKNLDSLNEKLKMISDLEDDRDFLAFYNEKASDLDAVKSYGLSSFYNSTSKSY